MPTVIVLCFWGVNMRVQSLVVWVLALATAHLCLHLCPPCGVGGSCELRGTPAVQPQEVSEGALQLCRGGVYYSCARIVSVVWEQRHCVLPALSRATTCRIWLYAAALSRGLLAWQR